MNKHGHVLNGLLLGIGLGFILAPDGSVETLRMIVAVTVPVSLGALFPDIDTEFGRHRKTLHNLPVLGMFIAFPFVFDNLHYVWIGVLTHYVLDVVGSKRGIALFYPFEQEYGFPTGVATKSQYTSVVTLVITATELIIVFTVVYGAGRYGWTVPAV
ncbi:metal-dependent hydrolase [Halocatena marina]|uniref:Metal-dependent hydrolase n=1 Tax=Halocatena marina TaxID=2934937 RepID=A0ABD5YQ81_9EURY|nr:metal-dependent hydrolase [Halocatena marina]